MGVLFFTEGMELYDHLNGVTVYHNHKCTPSRIQNYNNSIPISPRTPFITYITQTIPIYQAPVDPVLDAALPGL